MQHPASPWTVPCALLFALAGAADAATTVGDLRCENRRDPLGIDAARPRLSWILRSAQRGQRQTAYQVLVATTAAKLASDAPDLWDSGRVTSDQSTWVPYAGQPLLSHESCFWKVRVWDKDGQASSWSDTRRWSVGLLRPEAWKAKWIGLDGEEVKEYLKDTSWIWYPVGEPQKAAPAMTVHFRRVVTLPEGREIRRALLQYAGDDECRGWLDEFDLGTRKGSRTVKWLDIATRLEPGRSYVLGLTGYHRADGRPAGVVARLQIDFTSGEPLIVRTDQEWKVSESEVPGWNRLDFDDSGWVSVRTLGPTGMAPWGRTQTAEDRRLPARWLRQTFTAAKAVRRATAYFSGLGLSELYLNGQKVGDHVLSPALSDYEKRGYYVTFDVTDRIRRGVNALGVVLGGGRYYADRSAVYAGTRTFGWPKLLLHLRLEYHDGSSSEVVSDESWRLTTDGPIRAASEFDGEEYDARQELPGWSTPGYDDSKWRHASLVAAPPGDVDAQGIEPIRVTQTLRPAAMSEPRPGVFVFDMGQNMVGWCRLKVKGPAGAMVELRHAETLKPDGTPFRANLRGAQATDTYTLKGAAAGEVYEPRFTYHGFRYVEVRGFPGRPTLDALEGRVVHDDLPRIGDFASSNELLNQIYRNVVWGTRGNYRSIPTDCPQRDERQGWLGDRSEVSRGETYFFDNSLLYAKWLRDIRDAQGPDGSLPDVAPTSWPTLTDNVVWPSTFVVVPGMLQRQFGDAAPTEQTYDAARQWIEHMLGFIQDGAISRDQYGDWCVPPEDPVLIHTRDERRNTGKTLLATTYLCHDLRLMGRYAAQLGKADDASRFERLARELQMAFNGRLLDRQRGQYDNGTQTSCVLPLAFGLVPEDVRPRIVGHLVDKIEHETNGHIGTGLVGGQHLMRVLSDNGRADLAYSIATQKDYPGWGYMVSKGATTIWELWNGDTADPTMNSGNHVMLVGDLVIWLYESLAGIAPDDAQPGFKRVVMKPHPVPGLDFVRAWHRSPYGEIRSEWHERAGWFEWNVTIPANTTATVFVPAGAVGDVKESGRAATAVQGVTFLRMQEGRAVFDVVSGDYRFRARLP
jgi:alpha-L-rhamnosidase